MMKNEKSYFSARRSKKGGAFALLFVATALFTSCGQYKKEPVDGLDNLRSEGLKHRDDANHPPEEKINTVVQVKDQATQAYYYPLVDSNHVILKVPVECRFFEGEHGAYPITLTLANELKGYKFELEHDALPGNAKLELGTVALTDEQKAKTAESTPASTDNSLSTSYRLSWTPAVGDRNWNGLSIYTVELKAKLTAWPKDAKPEDVARLQQVPRIVQLTLIGAANSASVAKIEAAKADAVAKSNNSKKTNEATL